jgi:hypothetical protein
MPLAATRTQALALPTCTGPSTKDRAAATISAGSPGAISPSSWAAATRSLRLARPGVLAGVAGAQVGVGERGVPEDTETRLLSVALGVSGRRGGSRSDGAER